MANFSEKLKFGFVNKSFYHFFLLTSDSVRENTGEIESNIHHTTIEEYLTLIRVYTIYVKVR